jgi:hypothetical protein
LVEQAQATKLRAMPFGTFHPGKTLSFQEGAAFEAKAALVSVSAVAALDERQSSLEQ